MTDLDDTALPSKLTTYEVEVTLRLTVSQSVSLGVEPHQELITRYIYFYLTIMALLFWGALSDERTDLSFVYAADPCQRSLSRVRVPWDSRPYFTVSNLRLPFLSPLTTRSVMVWQLTAHSSRYIAAARTSQKKFYCWGLESLPNHCLATVAARTPSKTVALIAA
jgi:hypothetical protein